MDKPVRCAVMGQHPMRFPWGFDEEDESCGKMKMELAQQIMVLRQNGVSQFLVACDCGVGLYAAEIVNGLRAATDHDLMLICYTPREEQATKWAPYLRERYFDMLTACTYLSAVCEAGAPGAQLQAYKKIIDLADVVLADEISPDTCRFWDSTTHEKLDKDRFRRDMGGVEDAYQEIMHRIFGENK